MFKSEYKKKVLETMSLEDYVKKSQKNKTMYATAAERLLKAIGDPVLLDTAKDPRLSRIHGNKVIRTYPAFKDFYGLELVIDRIVSFFRHAAQGLEEARQILYLLGPVGSAKSSLSDTLKKLMEQEPIYVLADAEGNPSPIQESPLGILDHEHVPKIPVRHLAITASPWAVKRLDEYEGDLTKFKVFKMYPNQDRQISLAKTEPGDENNQDISALTGKLDIRKLEFHAQDDPDAYNYSGGLCRANQGLLEFVEMFKAPIKVLHPLLTATQEHNYRGTEAIGNIPFEGVILAHSNESEWEAFRSNKNNEAFLDRIYIVEVPYCLQIDEEVKIYEKLLSSSDLSKAPCAPGTLKMLAEFCVFSRLEDIENSLKVSKMKAYNGENIKEYDARAKSVHEYKDLASNDEGFSGMSTRFAYKVLSSVYNFDPKEIAADPVHLLYVLETTIKKERLSKTEEESHLTYIKHYLAAEFKKDLTKNIQRAYLESYSEYGQAMFDRYILFADHWVQDNDYRDPDTGSLMDRELLNQELTKLEKPAGITNPKDFRHEVVNYSLRYQAKNDGLNPKWTAYNKLRKVIEANVFGKTEDLLPVITYTGHGNSEDKKKHDSFISRMEEMGYTQRQVRRLVEWHMRYVDQ